MRSTTTAMMLGMIVFVVANLLVLGYAVRMSQLKSAAYAPPPAATTQQAVATSSGPPADPVKLQAAMSIGQTEFAKCAACHGPDGKGMLVGPAVMAPSLVGSPIAVGDIDKAALVVLKGIRKEDPKYTGIMAPLAMDDRLLAGVLTYVRNSFGNAAGLVTPEQAAAARIRFTNVPTMIGRNELDGLLAANPKVEPTAVASTAVGAAPAALPLASTPPKVEEPWVPLPGIRVVGGRVPSQRPAEAPPRPQLTYHDASWYSQALHGVSQPYPVSLEFLENQGRWFNPFTHPGMTGPYDIRRWHVD